MSRILDDLRKRGVFVRQTTTGILQIYSDSPVTEEIERLIRDRKEEILLVLEEERTQAAQEAEAKAKDVLTKAKGKKTRRGVATVERGGHVYIACYRRDGGSWVVQVPEEAYDPWRLSAIILSAAPASLDKPIPIDEGRKVK